MVEIEFHKEGTIEERQKKYEDHSDPLEKFLNEFIEDEPNSHIFKWEFEKNLSQWCIENKFRKLTDVWIGIKMKQKGINDGKVQVNWDNNNGQTKQIRAWLGVKWREKEEKAGNPSNPGYT